MSEDRRLSVESVVVSLDDRTMDLILDELTERGGRLRDTDALGLARWDLKAALRKFGSLPVPVGASDESTGRGRNV